MSLSALLLQEIQHEGPISVERFVALALGHPEYGYYMRRDPFGAKGDFITAPEISQMFGEMLAVWMVSVWQAQGCPPAALVEMGPGRGTLMQDFLRASRHVPGFHESLSIHLIETSPRLREIQQEKLHSLHPDIHWHQELEEAPDRPVFLLANELFDALPIRQYVKTAKGWVERLIDAREDKLCFASGTKIVSLPEYDPNLPPGSLVETCPEGEKLMAQIASRITRHGVGAALVVDYGYGGFQAGETFQAVRNHRYHPVLETPGEADLTAHVNFAALARAARGEGAHVFGPVGQGDFLEMLGIRARTERLSTDANEAQKTAILSDLERLTSKEQMGTLFKVMAICSTPQPLPGFQA